VFIIERDAGRGSLVFSGNFLGSSSCISLGSGRRRYRSFAGARGQPSLDLLSKHFNFASLLAELFIRLLGRGRCRRTGCSHASCSCQVSLCRSMLWEDLLIRRGTYGRAHVVIINRATINSTVLRRVDTGWATTIPMMMTTVAALVKLLVHCIVRHGHAMMLVVVRIRSMVMCCSLVVLMGCAGSSCIHHGHHSLLLLLLVHHIPIVAIQIDTLSLVAACSVWGAQFCSDSLLFLISRWAGLTSINCYSNSRAIIVLLFNLFIGAATLCTTEIHLVYAGCWVIGSLSCSSGSHMRTSSPILHLLQIVLGWSWVASVNYPLIYRFVALFYALFSFEKVTMAWVIDVLLLISKKKLNLKFFLLLMSKYFLRRNLAKLAPVQGKRNFGRAFAL